MLFLLFVYLQMIFPLSGIKTTGRPKSLGHFLRPHIFKTTMHDGKFETYLEREKKSGNYQDTKFTDITFLQ